ncbi:hypothetical protein Trichorick_01136 [Candidatus Trichorickettsia mobilis]|uniref:Uncharacterized protein n=1 Tax=Candidatus Trichorickettsia mobilis TaxID=1346319 RepID=A0ABZ0UT71_9RICK|nr:hypothetical protein Trichorick_01136 [Candidatus Trichorickettsia mobilis]
MQLNNLDNSLFNLKIIIVFILKYVIIDIEIYKNKVNK